VTERSNVLLAVLLLLGALAAGVLVGALAAIGGHGLVGLLAVAAGVATACVRLAFELRRLPPATLLVAIAALGSLGALARTVVRAAREQRLLRRLPSTPIARTRFAALGADAARIPVEVVPASAANAFCAGILRPRVLVTSGLLELLDEEERRAAIVHELEHARRRGPLKVSLARAVAHSLFWIPALRDLGDRYVLLCELEADRAAIAETGKAALAGALLEVIEAPRLAGAVGLSDFAASRVDRILDPRTSLPPLFRRSSMVATAAAVAGGVLLVLWAGRLGVGESSHLHAMAAQLLVHRVRDRLLGLGETAALVAAVVVAGRRLRSSRVP
jgi:beta-lactamase regulating signal transducer with metallopeptidase domain